MCHEMELSIQHACPGAHAGRRLHLLVFVLGDSMLSNDYHFITTWRVTATLTEVNDLIGNAPDLARWWPAVYLQAKELQAGDAYGLGKVVDLYTKGWLPYTLRWQFRVIESHYPHGFTLEAWGDFVGRGI